MRRARLFKRNNLLTIIYRECFSFCARKDFEDGRLRLNVALLAKHFLLMEANSLSEQTLRIKVYEV